jgi:hypothetical protein
MGGCRGLLVWARAAVAQENWQKSKRRNNGRWGKEEVCRKMARKVFGSLEVKVSKFSPSYRI